MIKFYIYFFIVLMLSGCVISEPKPRNEFIASNKKSFEQEDAFILFALRAEQIGDHKSAASLFTTLYEKSNKKEYLHRALQNNLAANEYEEILEKVNKEISSSQKDDFFMLRLKVLSLIGLKKYNEAKVEAISLVDKTQKIDDYLLLSDIYTQVKEYESAIKLLEDAYNEDYNEKLLNKMAIILYFNLGKKEDAIEKLEDHSRVHGCSKLICLRLAGFYSDENNIEGLLSTYLRLYEVEPSNEVVQKVVQAYTYKKDYIGMMNFLESTKSDDLTLLELYVYVKDYTKAYELAQKIYLQTNEINFLAQSAIYQYEGHENKNDKKMLKEVIKKLEKVVGVSTTPMYINYLGYILIDHEIDVKRGMKYIDKALVSEPNSIYFLDSLAWGYYKLGDCKQAKEVMDKVVKLEGSDNEEVISHVKSIDNCIKK